MKKSYHGEILGDIPISVLMNQMLKPDDVRIIFKEPIKVGSYKQKKRNPKKIYKR